ncbi:sporulation protein YqfD [Caldalkalibacillus salinus]|uniref:sporulation protein YqfD n=1 Tax=Caldalkalibacillus salinus TaxID=2803787 RepID=UPI00192250D7|nr:sporulation protein YqfD [Caldalkalibacillus salinus]
MSNEEMLHWWLGYVTIEIKGEKLERLINRMMNQRFAAWDIQRQNKHVATVSMTIEHFFKLRALLKETGCRVRIIKKNGLPFAFKNIRRRLGFTLGIVTFGLLLYLLSSMIWFVEIEGVQLPEDEQVIKQELANLGVKPGSFKFQVEDYQTIQRKIMEVIPDTTWVGFRFEGTTARLKVVEKTLPEIEDRPNPRHLVAKKKAIIHRMFVEQGQALVKQNEYVQPGDILVSGIIGTEEEPQVVAATGEVWGEVWYEGSISVPLEQNSERQTGERTKEYYLTFGEWALKVWGFKDPTFSSSRTEETLHQLHWKKWTFPIGWQIKDIKETNEVQHILTEEEAVDLGAKLAREKITRKLPPDAEIQEEKVLRKQVDSGKVYIKMHYTVIENIASEQIIIQGD